MYDHSCNIFYILICVLFCRLLAFLVVAEAKLKSWTVKYNRQQQVEAMLEDYQVCYFFVYNFHKLV